MLPTSTQQVHLKFPNEHSDPGDITQRQRSMVRPAALSQDPMSILQPGFCSAHIPAWSRYRAPASTLTSHPVVAPALHTGLAIILLSSIQRSVSGPALIGVIPVVVVEDRLPLLLLGEYDMSDRSVFSRSGVIL